MSAMSTAEHQAQREWLTTAEAAALSGRSARTLRRWAARDQWRTRLDILAGGHAPTRFYARADVLASVRGVAGQMADGAQVGATADGALGAHLAAMPQRLELMQATLERMTEALGEHRDALHRHAAALEAQAQRAPISQQAQAPAPWWDRAADVGQIAVAALAGILLGLGLAAVVLSR